jgi:hypothetical protein
MLIALTQRDSVPRREGFFEADSSNPHENLGTVMNDNNDANTQRAIRPVTSTEATSSAPLASTSGDSKHPTIRPVSSVLTRAREAKKNPAAPLGKRTQATYPIQKPPKSKYVRVHRDADYRQGSILTYTDTDSGEIYYVSPDLELPDSVADCVKITDFYARADA